MKILTARALFLKCMHHDEFDAVEVVGLPSDGKGLEVRQQADLLRTERV